VAEQIIIELLVDDSQLLPAIDLLEKTGQIDAKLANGFRQTTAEINKQAQAIKADAAATAPLKKNLEDISKATKSVSQSFMQGFQEGVIDTLKEAGVSVKEFTDALGTGGTEVQGPVESLRQRLRTLTQQIAELKLSGQDNTEQFRELVIEAGRVKDAMNDAGQEIRNAGSDTRVFDNLIGSAQALAGGFAVAQGTAALFGDESEELQKTLLKVNAAMAILQGLQQIQNALQKEGAITQLLANRQRIVTNAQIAIENGLNSTSIVVRTAAAGAQRVLNAAMAANPIGILVVAIAGLITLLSTYGASAAEARRQTSNLNVALDQGAKNFEERANAIKQLGDESVKNLELEGAVGSKIAQQEVFNQSLIVNARKERLAELRSLEASSTEAELKKRQELNAAIRELEDQLLTDELAAGNLETKQKRVLLEEDLKNRIAVSEVILANAQEGSKEQIEIQKRLITQKAALELNADGLLESQRAAILAQAEREKQELQIAFDKRRIDLQLKSIDTQLINVKEGSQEEFNLRIQQLRLQVQAEIASTKLSESEKKAIKEKGFQDELKLQREFNERLRREAIEGQISLNAAEIANVRITAEDKLLLTIANIELAAAIEVDAAKGNANKIKEINAKRDADIAATRKAFIETEAQAEIDRIGVREGETRRALQRIADDEKQAARTRITAIQQIAETDLEFIEIRENALEEERAKRLIGEQEYNDRYEKLQDEKAQLSENTEKKITDIHTSESEKRRKIDQETIELALNTTQEVLDLVGQLNDIRAQKDEERLEGERARVQELLETGAITEKEAINRNKRIDAEEKKLRREAAQRDKALAIFNSIINTARAVTAALTSVPPNVPLAIAVGIIGAAQTAIIAARPIPKFKVGKKGNYQGPGIIGEDGAEILEQSGKRYLAQKETLVWLGKQDKVYTPQETKRMLPGVDRELMKQQPSDNAMDADRFAGKVAEAVADVIREMPQTNLTVDNNGFQVSVQEGMSKKIYMDKYYSSK
jgi:hypothetical protein